MLLTFFLTHVLDSMPFVPTLLSVREYIFFRFKCIFLAKCLRESEKSYTFAAEYRPLSS